MIRVVIEVCQEAARYRLTVQSSSIRAALSVVEEHYLAGGEARVVFPIEPEPFFVTGSGAAGLIGIELVEETFLETNRNPLREGVSVDGPDGSRGSRGGGTSRSEVKQTIRSAPPRNPDRSGPSNSV